MTNCYERIIRTLDIRPGEVIDVASDFTSLFMWFRDQGEDLELGRLLDELLTAVGPEGTVLIRAFTWDFCQGKPFDRLHAKSRVGKLGDVAAKHAAFVRTAHPIYSWWVAGHDAARLAELDYADSFSDESVFAYLERAGARELLLGQIKAVADGMTHMHRAEQLAGEPHRYVKDFSGTYIDVDGSESTRTYSMFVRDLGFTMEEEMTSVLQPRLCELGIADIYSLDGLSLKSLKLGPFCELMLDDIKSGRVKEYVRYVPCS